MVPSELVMSENILFLNKVTFLDTGVEDLDIPSLRGWMGTQVFHIFLVKCGNSFWLHVLNTVF